MSTQYDLPSDCDGLSIGNNDNDTTINPLYSLDLGSEKEDNAITQAFAGKVAKNFDTLKYKKSNHNHLFSPMHIKNEIIERP